MAGLKELVDDRERFFERNGMIGRMEVEDTHLDAFESLKSLCKELLEPFRFVIAGLEWVYSMLRLGELLRGRLR